MAKTKHNEERLQDKDQFKLLDDDDEILGKVDRPLILLRQIDRINRLSAFGLLTEYINAINHFEALLPMVSQDKTFRTELQKEKQVYELERSNLKDYEKGSLQTLDAEFHRAKFQLLIALMSRKGMW